MRPLHHPIRCLPFSLSFAAPVVGSAGSPARSWKSRITWKETLAVLVSSGLACLLATGLLPGLASAEGFHFLTIDYPGSSSTEANGINDSGDVVGVYVDPNEPPSANDHGFLLSSGTFAPINRPGGSHTEAMAINNLGDIVGGFEDPNLPVSDNDLGFLLSGGTYTTIDCPQGVDEWTADINESGMIIDEYFDPNGVEHGFLYSAGTCTPIDCVGAIDIALDGIDSAGTIVGLFSDANSVQHVFRRSAGDPNCTPVPLSIPDYVDIDGTNDAGDIVGTFVTLEDDEFGVGFVLSNGTVSTIEFPGATATSVRDINNFGQVVGTYEDGAGNLHGFVATPSSAVPAFRHFELAVLGCLVLFIGITLLRGAVGGHRWRRTPALRR